MDDSGNLNKHCHGLCLLQAEFLYTFYNCLAVRVRPKFGFGFGYGAETDITHGFCLVSATAKVHWHEFGFGRNITPKRRNRRNCKIGANCDTGSLAVRLLAVGGQSGAYASWSRRPQTSSSSHRIMGGIVLQLQCAAF